MSITVQLSGLEPLLKQIDSVAKLEGVQAAMMAGATHFKGRIDKYPPSSDANNPANRHWYERGYGSRWRRRDGSMGGKKTSEMLNRKWTVARRGQLEVVLGNNVSYSPYVHDEERQPRFHKARNWPTIQGVAREETPIVVKFIEDYLKKKFGLS